MIFKLHNQKKEEAKIKLALKGVSGSGKFLSSLLLAKGLSTPPRLRC